MGGRDTRVLVICHVSAANVAGAAARARFLNGDGPVGADGDASRAVDLLCYGRTSDDFPAPRGTRLVGSFVPQGVARRSALRLLSELRQRKYHVVALSQPALGLNRARGLLLVFSVLVSRKRAVILDPTADRVVSRVGLRLATADLVRWAFLQLVSWSVTQVVAWPLARLSAGLRPAREVEPGGLVVYLRTDIELGIAPLTVGGSAAHTEGIVRALLDRGHSVVYAGTGEVDGVPSSIPRVRLPSLLKGNLPVEIAELVSGILQGLAIERRLRAARLRSRPRFVYQRYSLNNLAGLILSRRWNVPLVLEANGSEAKWRQDFGSLKYPKLAYACERLIVRRADVVAAVSENAAADLVASGAPPERVRVVPNGVVVNRFAAALPMPLPGGFRRGFVVCFVGLFYPWHGARYLAEAFAMLHARCPNARLLLVGDGEDAPAVRAVLERHSVLNAVHFTGLVARGDAPRYMAAADVLVSPHANVHRFIGSPIKLFEYMAAGKPIVATRVGQIEHVLVHEQTALLVAPEDPAAMADALERLHDERALRERLGRAAQIEALTRHSWDARLAAIFGGAGAAAYGTSAP